MKKLLPPLLFTLLVVGCETLFEFEVEGICVLTNTTTNANNCYPDTTESQCNSDANNSQEINLRYWGESFDCNEYCNSQIPNEICEIN